MQIIYMHAKRVCKDLEVKNGGACEYHEFGMYMICVVGQCQKGYQ